MIRRVTLILGAVATVATILASQVEAQDGWSASVGAGPSLPMSDLADEAKRGYHFQATLGRSLGDSPIGIRAELFYQLFRNVPREAGLYNTLGGEWFRQADAFLGATYTVPMGSVAPYGVIGAGWGQEWHGDRTYFGTRQGNISVNGGAGVNFPVFGAAAFIEARFVGLFGGNPLPLRPPAVQDEVRFQSIPITFGFRF